ncbi:MAG: hypothetical protein M3R63_09805 [Actinomycetota bacterium]|nr:hypothetical protein [Actinomycetota bacterium]
MRPEWTRLERPGQAPAVWGDAQPRFDSAVLGPHFEELYQDWAARFADDAILDGQGRVVELLHVTAPADRNTFVYGDLPLA